MRVRRRLRKERKRAEQRRTRRAAVGRAALTAALTLTAARHGGADAHARRTPSGIVQAAALPELTMPMEPAVPVGKPRRPRTRHAPFDAHIRAAAAKHGVSPDLVRAIIQVESGFDHRAVSPRGARGLMQLMPGTARDMGARNLFDPRQNIFAGARYLRVLLDAFDGDVTLAAAAYNAGPTVVQRYGGVPPYRETQNYVEKVHSLLGLPPSPAFVEALLELPAGLATAAADLPRRAKPPRRAP